MGNNDKFYHGEYAEWEQIEVAEHQFVSNCHSILQKEVNSGFDFIGFVYNGVVLPESRDQTIALSRQALKRLQLTQTQSAVFLGRLTRLYLDTCGVGSTINNLILQADYFSPRTTPPKSVRLEFGGRDSLIKNGRQRLINISDPVANLLGISNPLWTDIAKELKTRKSITPKTAKRLRATSELIKSASRYVVWEERRFLQDLEEYVFGTSETRCPSEVLKVLPAWLRAFQGLFMFVNLFGKHWITAPVTPRFMNHFKQIGFNIPCCAITAISQVAPDTQQLLKVGNSIQASDPNKIGEHVDSLSKTFVKDLQRDKKEIHASLAAIIERFDSDKFGANRNWTKDIQRFLEIGIKLIGKKHEQKPLSFVLLCAPAGSLLRYHIKSAQHPWVLRSIAKLSIADFPSLDDRTAPEQLDTLVFSIETNAFLLQERGRALYFLPVSTQFAPRHVVTFEPFDGTDIDNLLREFTGNDQDALAIRVGEKQARLFAAGKKIAVSQGQVWKMLDDGLDAGGWATIADAVCKLPGWKKSGRSRTRIDKICKSVIEVSKRGYGALFFITNSGNQPAATELAPVWCNRDNSPPLRAGGKAGNTHKTRIDDVPESTIAAYAGLDGETRVHIHKGYYQTRQFCHVPATDFLELLQRDEQGRICLNPEYNTAYQEMRKQFSQMVSADEIYKMGTRHQKALRVTWAKAHRKNTIAITVSSDGPVRLWYKGCPVYKWDAAF